MMLIAVVMMANGKKSLVSIWGQVERNIRYTCGRIDRKWLCVRTTWIKLDEIYERGTLILSVFMNPWIFVVVRKFYASRRLSSEPHLNCSIIDDSTKWPLFWTSIIVEKVYQLDSNSTLDPFFSIQEIVSTRFECIFENSWQLPFFKSSSFWSILWLRYFVLKR